MKEDVRPPLTEPALGPFAMETQRRRGGGAQRLAGGLEPLRPCPREVQLFICSVCGISFDGIATFARHQRSHMGDKPFQCSDCGKYFKDWVHLAQHQQVHTGESPFKCPVCGKGFNDLSNFSLHHRSHVC